MKHALTIYKLSINYMYEYTVFRCLRGMDKSCVACLGIQRKSGGNIHLYIMFHYYCGLILWRSWKKPFCAETRNFDVKAEQQSCIKFSVEPVQTTNLLKLNESAKIASRTLVYPSHKQITDKVLYESERKGWWTVVGFHGTINVSNVLAVKERCASDS
jgi:hypothetical protein